MDRNYLVEFCPYELNFINLLIFVKNDCDVSNKTTCSGNKDTFLIPNSQSDRCKKLVLFEILHYVSSFSLRLKIPKTLMSQLFSNAPKILKGPLNMSFRAKPLKYDSRGKNNFPMD